MPLDGRLRERLGIVHRRRRAPFAALARTASWPDSSIMSCGGRSSSAKAQFDPHSPVPAVPNRPANQVRGLDTQDDRAAIQHFGESLSRKPERREYMVLAAFFAMGA